MPLQRLFYVPLKNKVLNPFCKGMTPCKEFHLTFILFRNKELFKSYYKYKTNLFYLSSDF